MRRNLPEKVTLGLAMSQALKNYRDLLRANHIPSYDWIEILRAGGKIKFSSAGAEILLPKRLK